MISFENLTKTYGEKQLFNQLSFTIAEKERVGLIGVNGTGKSSLLKIVAGIDLPDEGEVVKGKDYVISYLAQDPELNDELTILDQVFFGDAPIFRIQKEYERIYSKLQQHPENSQIQEKLFEIHRQMDALNAWDVHTNAKTILTKLGIEKFDRKISELSGGQKKRVALAQALIESPDLLILDEPTNHLDYETVKWLEEFLSRYSGALLLVTHDRYFLDRVTNRIFELSQGNLYAYKGNYAAFLESKAIREENDAATIAKRKNLYRNELEWIRRGAKARTTKQKARIQRFEQLEEKVVNETSNEKLEISLAGSRLGKQVFELKAANKKLGDLHILTNFDLLVKPGDRLGVIGRNGAGKSTLLKILASELNLDSGEFILGQTVKIAYYKQEMEDMNPNQRMIEYLRETAQIIQTSDGKSISASQMLERFLFSMSMHGTPIRKLSGGEKRRLYLLKLLMTSPNVLLLDEPTNDLDTETLTVLEDYLDDFPGVVITVSHDRYFLDKVVDQLLIVKGNGMVDKFYGNYSEYLESVLVVQKETEVIKEKAKSEVTSKKKKMTYMEKKEWEEIDDKISATEEKLENIQEEMNHIGSDFEKAQRLTEEQEALNQQLEDLIERWSYLAELAE